MDQLNSDCMVAYSFLGRTLVVRATHNIQPGEEIAHCYGEMIA